MPLPEAANAMPKDAEPIDRRQRQAMALRANLKRRKAQARSRGAAIAAAPSAGFAPQAVAATMPPPADPLAADAPDNTKDGHTRPTST